MNPNLLMVLGLLGVCVGLFVANKPRMDAVALLVIGPWKAIRQLQSQPQDFLVLSLPMEVGEVAPVQDRAPQALMSVAMMVILMVTGVVPNVVEAVDRGHDRARTLTGARGRHGAGGVDCVHGAGVVAG